jgi:hypothetical protein
MTDSHLTVGDQVATAAIGCALYVVRDVFMALALGFDVLAVLVTAVVWLFDEPRGETVLPIAGGIVFSVAAAWLTRRTRLVADRLEGLET